MIFDLADDFGLPLTFDPYDDHFRLYIAPDEITSEDEGEYELIITLVDDKSVYTKASNKHSL